MNNTSPGTSGLFTVALVAVAMTMVLGTAAHAQTVPAAAGTTASTTRDGLAPGPGAEEPVAPAWVAQPKVDVTFAATRRVALIASFAYTFSTPDVSVTVTQGGQQTFRAADHVRVDSVGLRVGAAVSLF